MVHPLGCGHPHGSVHGNTHQADPRVDPTELPHSRGNCSNLSGLGEGMRISNINLVSDQTSCLIASCILCIYALEIHDLAVRHQKKVVICTAGLRRNMALNCRSQEPASRSTCVEQKGIPEDGNHASFTFWWVFLSLFCECYNTSPGSRHRLD